MQLSQLPVATHIPHEWQTLFDVVDAASAGKLWPIDFGMVGRRNATVHARADVEAARAFDAPIGNDLLAALMRLGHERIRMHRQGLYLPHGAVTRSPTPGWRHREAALVGASV